jgi:mono/diheme cytochrome c family protein
MVKTRKFLNLSFIVAIGMLVSSSLISCGGGTPSTTTTRPPTTTNPPTTTTTPPTTTTSPPTTTTVPPTTTTVPPTTTSGIGVQVYTASCASCHGADRKGLSSGGITLYPPVLPTSPGVGTRTEAQLATYIATHQTGSSLTVAQRTAVAAFLKAT